MLSYVCLKNGIINYYIYIYLPFLRQTYDNINFLPFLRQTYDNINFLSFLRQTYDNIIFYRVYDKHKKIKFVYVSSVLPIGV